MCIGSATVEDQLIHFNINSPDPEPLPLFPDLSEPPDLSPLLLLFALVGELLLHSQSLGFGIDVVNTGPPPGTFVAPVVVVAS